MLLTQTCLSEVLFYPMNIFCHATKYQLVIICFYGCQSLSKVLLISAKILIHCFLLKDLAFGLSSMVSGLKKRVHLLLKLIMSVTVDTLTQVNIQLEKIVLFFYVSLIYFSFLISQENVSCLNTAIVFFMFSLNKGELHLYLRAFQHEEAALKKPGFIIDNLRLAILFHYVECWLLCIYATCCC